MRWITEVPSTGSTNADMLTLAGREFREGQWLMAGQQESGRGRQGRVWQSPTGNLYATTLVCIGYRDPVVHSLGLLAGVALWDAVRAVGLTTAGLSLKWPNDLMIGSAKLAGILLERQGDWVAAGFGVNVAEAPHLPGRDTVSLHSRGVAISPSVLCKALADSFAAWLERWRTYGVAPIVGAWRERALPLGTRITVTGSDGVPMKGDFAGLGDDGALLLGRQDGTIETIYAADVAMVAGEGENG